MLASGAVDSTSLQLRELASAEWIIAAGIGIYITGVTWFARTEARVSQRAQLVGGMVVILVGIGLLRALPEWKSLVVSQISWYFLWGVIGLTTGIRCLRAVADPLPKHVQAAVKHCILSIILLDAAVTAGVRGVADGAIILGLLIPMSLLGRWVYST